MRALRPATREIVGPPYAYEGERERLVAEYRDIKRCLVRLAPNSRLRAGLEHRLKGITTRLLMIGEAQPSIAGAERKDLQ